MNAVEARKSRIIATKELESLTNFLTTPRLIKKAKHLFQEIDPNIISSIPGSLSHALNEFSNKTGITLQEQQWILFEALRQYARKSQRTNPTTPDEAQDIVDDACDVLKEHILDGLTGLFTKKTLDKEMPYHIKGSIVTLDLDKFKQINDTCGHHAGDRALEYFSNILKKVKLSDTFKNKDIELYRNGGDEFVIVIEDDKYKTLAKEFAEAVQGKLIKDPFTYNDNKPYLGASIGIGTYSHSTTFKEALIKSDGAVYRNKKERKKERKKQLRSESLVCLDKLQPYAITPLKMAA